MCGSDCRPWLERCRRQNTSSSLAYMGDTQTDKSPHASPLHLLTAGLPSLYTKLFSWALVESRGLKYDVLQEPAILTRKLFKPCQQHKQPLGFNNTTTQEEKKIYIYICLSLCLLHRCGYEQLIFSKNY